MTLTEVYRTGAGAHQPREFTNRPLKVEGYTSPHQTAPLRQDRSVRLNEEMGSLIIHVATRSGVVSLDLSHEDARKELLDALKEGGYVVLKNATSLDSVEQARRNKYVAALFASARNGIFESRVVHKPYSSLSLIPFGRPHNWRKLADERELVAATCYHLGGDENVQWNLEYDTGLQRELVNKTATIEACGRDIIICNGWLARAVPKPKAEVDLIMVMHRSPDFDWDA